MRFCAIISAHSDRKTGIHFCGIRARAVDVGAAIGEVAAGNRFMVGAMMRIGTAAILAAIAGVFSLPATGASAQTAPSAMRTVQVSQPVATEASAQRRVRPPTRLRVYPPYQPGPDGVYPRYYPGRNAVRDCSTTYVQEYRASGMVIVPHMSCFWRRG
jgi:hypothetical protein